MFALEYVVLSLISNDYVRERHAILPTIMGNGAIIGGFFTILFVIYADNFYQKQRKQELGIYNILGLEKKHIRRIIVHEQMIKFLIITALSLLAGQLLGALIFLALNKIMGQVGVPLMAYSFSAISAAIIVGIHLAIQVFLYLKLRFQLWRYNPIHWLHQEKAGEREPRGNLLFGLVGLAMVIAGYLTANQNVQVINAIPLLFAAVILVIIGTYLIFRALIIRLLLALKRRPNYYYQPTHFLTLSGMLYRMRANAISLASIAVLSTGVILVLGLTTSLFASMLSQPKQIIETDYRISTQSPDLNSDQDAIELLNQGLQLAGQDLELTEHFYHQSFSSFASLENQRLSPIEPNSLPQNDQVGVYLLVEPLSDYRSRTGEKIELKSDEILLSANRPNIQIKDKVVLNTKSYDIQGPVKHTLGYNIGVEAISIVVPDSESFEAVRQAFPTAIDPQAKQFLPAPIRYAVYFNGEGDGEALTKQAEDFANLGLEFESRQEIQDSLFEINGGLLFLGIVTSLILILGTGLMLYYKQISEGLDDRKNFQIMKRVGLEDQLIKRTIRSQILWVFILPLAVAILHTLAASKLVFNNLLRMIQAVHTVTIVLSVVGVIVGFSICYLIYYWFTSRIYYQLINERDKAL
ncbi:FtsX-like permease family protein [Aerococcus sp. HMSC035B07]|uniref:FtsX-like permease family protein n=2 Tax=Aerococcus TaxID=1375 RepID=UPI0009F52A4E|nr:FtsX-like permease family protein [Aerococcus sp. HMSC035B07]